MRARMLEGVVAGIAVLVVLLMLGAGQAFAAGVSPWWGLTVGTRPSSLPAVGGTGQVVLTAENLGDAPADGGLVAVRMVAVLPAGLEAVGIKGVAGEAVGVNRGPVSCALGKLECTFSSVPPSTSLLPPFEQMEMVVVVRVRAAAATGAVVSGSVSGGGAAHTVAASRRIVVGGPTRFGFEDFRLLPEEPGGRIDTQAGSHPFQLTNVVTLNTQTPDAAGRPRSAGLARDVVAQLPPGMIGNPTPFAQCTDAQFAKSFESGSQKVVNECPASSAIGVATVTVNEPTSLGFATVTSPIFNMTPRVGEPARFGFKVAGFFPVFLDTSLRTGGDYGVTVTASDLTQIAWALSAKLTFWGVPGDARHDKQRGWECLDEFGECPTSTSTTPPPFLVLPTSCEAPFLATLGGDSWGSVEHPAETAEPVSYRLPEAIDGCNQLPFAPSIRVTPDGTAASSPTGLNVDVHVPQGAVLNAESLAQSAVRQITVALPEGVAVNPSGSDGLAACTEGQVGYRETSGDEALFTPVLGEPFCPDASKVGTVQISSPLLPPGQHVNGAVYIAAQNANPFGSLIGIYIVAEDPISGTIVKQAGEVHLSETGQLITTISGVPQLAFEDAELHFFGGERAPLSTPARCGAYTTDATFAPWSGNPPVSSASTFNIASGPHGSPCPGASLPFSPSLTGGPTNINAGAFSPLTTTIGRADGNQDMQSVVLHMPPGLSGLLSSVALCPEAQANAGTCGPDSLIGETTVSAGVGSDPVSVVGGKVYITEHYAGAPFGLSIVNPVKAGPFDLEHDTANPAQQPACDCVVVRARINVDPTTAALTITTDPSGPHAIPHLIDGIPVQIQKVNVLINRPGFTFNSTNCNPAQITGAIVSAEGASSPVSVPFQVTNCATLRFTPQIVVATAAKASRVNGASLHFKISYPKNAMGSQSWFNEAKFQLPKQLPARLTTIQKACLAATFEANPSSCPAHSLIGHAVVHTEVLPVPLEGPVYFVSYGGAKFPEAVLVLKGYGITVDLHGETFINGKTGVTSATFRNTPDVPFESIEVTIPTGPFSEFGANLPAGAHESFCGQKLVMPTLFKASNGLEIHQNTLIGVTGCPKTKTRAQKLAAALKACHKKHGHKRSTCEQAARKHYGAKSAKAGARTPRGAAGRRR
jgi:hypothetical protein